MNQTEFPWIFLVLAAAVVVFGAAVVVVSRRRASDAPPVATPRPDSSTNAQPVAPPGLRGRLAAARTSLVASLAGVVGAGRVDESTWGDLEDALIRADVGVHVARSLVEPLRAAKPETADALLEALRAEMAGRLAGAERTLRIEPGVPNVWLVVGVNGAGKTTSIGKLAAREVAAGRRVLVAAGDTFRAAAADQLATWAERAGAEIVRGAEGGDPASVVFDATERAVARGIDLVLADTAGRLQSNRNLMDELAKVRRVAERGTARVTEVLLVIDATTGQNGLSQAKHFADATGVTGVVLTKMDGSAKGGIVFAIETELGIPVKMVGIGEAVDDLVPFEADEFVAALFEPSAA